MLVTNIFSFFQNVFYSSKQNFDFLFKINLLSANAVNLDRCQILKFGKGVKVNISTINIMILIFKTVIKISM